MNSWWCHEFQVFTKIVSSRFICWILIAKTFFWWLQGSVECDWVPIVFHPWPLGDRMKGLILLTEGGSWFLDDMFLIYSRISSKFDSWNAWHWNIYSTWPLFCFFTWFFLVCCVYFWSEIGIQKKTKNAQTAGEFCFATCDLEKCWHWLGELLPRMYWGDMFSYLKN